MAVRIKEQMQNMKFSFGANLYFWQKQDLEHFYNMAKNSSVDIIYLGETVCSKRRELKFDDWMALAKEIAASGKQVVLSTLALVEAAFEVRDIRRYVENGEFLIEANDLAAVNIAYENKLPFVAGNALNCYNAQALRQLVTQGMTRWCMPVELSRDWLQKTIESAEKLKIRDAFEVEVLSHGYLPLAYSARCFTARSEDRPKDQCELCCIKYPQGRAVYSQENQKVFVLNGIQTQSGFCYNLMHDIASMQGLVDIVRLSPLGNETFDALYAFQKGSKGEELPENPMAEIEVCNGYWHGEAGLNWQHQPT